MPTNILMPALSPTMEKGNLARWLKKEGDPVKPGDILAEVETDKATMEVEAVDEGILVKIVVPDGTTDVPVNDVIGVIAAEGEHANVAVARSEPVTETPTGRGSGATEERGTVRQEDESPDSVSLSESGANNGRRIFVSPLARRIAQQAKLDLAQIPGSGPHGRIIERDVQAVLAAKPERPEVRSEEAVRPRAEPAPASDDAIKKIFAPGSYEEIPHDSMRRAIARRLTLSSQTIPHFFLTIDCNIDALLTLRKTINATAPKDKEGTAAFKISVNDFIIKAFAMSLIRVPDANVTWTESAMLKHKQADIGVAIAIPGGLITPVIRAVEIKTLSAISQEMKDFSSRARARKLKPQEYEGGSAAVSNLGMFGIKSFSAILNPPHALILAVGAGEPRIVVKDGAPAVSTVMSLTLSTDHRAVDGALGAELLSVFKSLIENPLGMLV